MTSQHECFAKAPWLKALLVTIGVCGGCVQSAAPSKGPAVPTSVSMTPAGESADQTNLPSPGSPAPPTSAPAGQHAVVPQFPMITEIEGIPIPRSKVEVSNLQLKGPIPADVGNPHAASKPSTPVTGDAISIRFNSEPKVLNPITENSAVKSYITQFVLEGLARQDPETFEYTPNIASGWVVEDSVKLAPTYSGKQRRLKRTGPGFESAELQTEATIDHVAPQDDKALNEVVLQTTDETGAPVPRTWVGVFAVGTIEGTPSGGYHLWSDNNANLTIPGLPTGRYTVKVGAEVYGVTVATESGGLVVSAKSPGNPLGDWLKSSGQNELTLADTDWIDRQAQTVFTFQLRDDVKWSDGAAFTARDLAFAYAVINNPTADGDSLRGYYKDLVACEPTGDHSIRMQYRQQYFLAFEFTAGLSAYTPPWHIFEKHIKAELGLELTLETLSDEEASIAKKMSVHSQAFGKLFNNNEFYNQQPLGTGPYTIQTWERGDRLELLRRPDYWNAAKPAYLDRIVCRFIIDNVTALRAVKAGEIDFMWQLNAEQFHEDMKSPTTVYEDKLIKASWFSPMFNYYGWNMLKPKFQDRRVRMAMTLLCNREEFLAKKLYGDGVVVSGSQYYFGPGYDHSVPPVAYDPNIAKELLTDAGWADTDGDGVLDKGGDKFEIGIMLPPGNKLAEDRVTLLQRSLLSVGIKLNIQTLEWASFIEKVRAKDFDVVTLSWATSIESDPYQIWHSSGAGKSSRGSNHVSYSNPEADQLIEQIRVTLGEKERMQLHHAFHRVLDADQPYTFLFCAKDYGVYHKRFRNVKWYRQRPGFDLTEWYVPKDEQLRN